MKIGTKNAGKRPSGQALMMLGASLENDQWSLLILREFFLEGTRRFAVFQAELALSPNTLSARLKKLEETGLLSRKVYSQHPPRAQYSLTEKGAPSARS